MLVCQVKKFELRSKAEDLMTAREYREAKHWLGTWTILNNIPMVVADTEAEATAKLRVHCLKVLAPHKYPAQAFEFMVGLILNNKLMKHMLLLKRNTSIVVQVL